MWVTGCSQRWHSLRKDSPDVSWLTSSVTSSLVFLGRVLCFSAGKGRGPLPCWCSVPGSQCGWEQLQHLCSDSAASPGTESSRPASASLCWPGCQGKGRKGNEGTLLIPCFSGEPRQMPIFSAASWLWISTKQLQQSRRAAAMSLSLWNSNACSHRRWDQTLQWESSATPIEAISKVHRFYCALERGCWSRGGVLTFLLPKLFENYIFCMARNNLDELHVLGYAVLHLHNLSWHLLYS